MQAAVRKTKTELARLAADHKKAEEIVTIRNRMVSAVCLLLTCIFE